MVIRLIVLLAAAISCAYGLFVIPEELNDLPTEFSWDNVNGSNYLPPVRNQWFPQPCNSGWAMAATNVINSRIKILRNAKWPDVQLSPQVLLDCDSLDYGCFGGDPWTAYKWIQKNNITDETCNTYMAKSTGRCTSATKCMKCQENIGCIGQINAKVYALKSVGSVAGQTDMMQEIYSKGPISCAIGVTPQLKNYTKGIFADTTDSRKIQHYVLVYGWGVENGTKFWRVQNSWGYQWGESGSLRMVKGSNNLSIETECSFAVPQDTWTNDIRNTTPPSPSNHLNDGHRSFTMNEKAIPQYKSVDIIAAPTSFDWRSPINYLTVSRTDTSPKHCSTAWAFAVTSTMSDKIKIATKGKSIVQISPQVLLNCGVGSCTKGTADDAISFARKFGVPEDSCQNYIGEEPSKTSCSEVQSCAICSGTIYNYTCTAAKNNKRWLIPDTGKVSGVQNIKTEISSFGPIVCAIHVSPSFYEYTGGIFHETTIYPTFNHYVQVVGYGNAQGQDYWVCRNFWGTAWGQSGFFRIAMHGNNLGIEKDCSWLGAPA